MRRVVGYDDPISLDPKVVIMSSGLDAGATDDFRTRTCDGQSVDPIPRVRHNGDIPPIPPDVADGVNALIECNVFEFSATLRKLG